MCGIFGITVNEEYDYNPKALKVILRNLFLLSESRGKEASGVSISTRDDIYVYKDSKSASSLIHDHKYTEFINRILGKYAFSNGVHAFNNVAILGHSRLVTNGAQQFNENNQPIIKSGSVGIHNGIIVNQNDIWKKFPEMKRRYQVDSEVIFALIRMFYKNGLSLDDSVRKTFLEIQGVASIAVLFDDLDYLLLATNNGSLYQCVSESNHIHLFASEKYIINKLLKRPFINKLVSPCTISQVKAGEARLININDLSIKHFSINSKTPCIINTMRSKARRIHSILKDPRSETSEVTNTGLSVNKLHEIFERFSYDNTNRDKLKRCSRCILPETMPFIKFDAKGVCNYCLNYNKLKFFGTKALEKAVAPYRNENGEPDCIVAISGGRDSTYALHYTKTVLKMNPVAYTYDWGMVTDLARRNISRICGKLGIEHILVSADISRKRKYIRKNVSAWLRRPCLGMVPLFMAGDKMYFYYHYQVCKQFGVKLAIQGENMLERTDFKSGFAGVPPYNLDPFHSNTLSIIGALRLAFFYFKETFKSPRYINSSILDTFSAYLYYFIIKRNYINLYSFIPWVESDVVSTLVEEYDWELAPDTKSTWRIGDGTAAFYNYIYLSIAGFTENDTFRSNQIREGFINRAEALKLIEDDNKSRFESIQWYLDTINMGDYIEEVLSIISNAPKLYRTS